MRIALGLEFLIVFVLLPVAFAMRPFPIPALPVLWLVTLYCYLVLRRTGQTRGPEFWNTGVLATEWRPIVGLFLPAAAALAAAVWFCAPRLFLNLPRHNPLLWAVILVLYPVLSVAPQTLIYRAFLFERYQVFFRSGSFRSDPALILASAAAFGWLHIALRNWVAPLITFPAGLLFAWRYVRTRSLAASAFEHALYGCAIFTVGLGVYFYSGAAR